jgi:uncharacterized Zn-finger protein
MRLYPLRNVFEMQFIKVSVTFELVAVASCLLLQSICLFKFYRISTSPDFYGCSACLVPINRLSHYKKTVNSVIKLKCVWPQCQFETHCQNYLKKHYLIHSKVKKFKCDFENCNKVFNRKDALKLHKFVHSVEKSFTCDWNQCGLKFKPRDTLNKHKNYAHLKTKIFECSFDGCHKRLNRRDYLKSLTRSFRRETISL